MTATFSNSANLGAPQEKLQDSTSNTALPVQKNADAVQVHAPAAAQAAAVGTAENKDDTATTPIADVHAETLKALESLDLGGALPLAPADLSPLPWDLEALPAVPVSAVQQFVPMPPLLQSSSSVASNESSPPSSGSPAVAPGVPVAPLPNRVRTLVPVCGDRDAGSQRVRETEAGLDVNDESTLRLFAPGSKLARRQKREVLADQKAKACKKERELAIWDRITGKNRAEQQKMKDEQKAKLDEIKEKKAEALGISLSEAASASSDAGSLRSVEGSLSLRSKTAAQANSVSSATHCATTDLTFTGVTHDLSGQRTPACQESKLELVAANTNLKYGAVSARQLVAAQKAAGGPLAMRKVKAGSADASTVLGQEATGQNAGVTTEYGQIVMTREERRARRKRCGGGLKLKSADATAASATSGTAVGASVSPSSTSTASTSDVEAEACLSVSIDLQRSKGSSDCGSTTASSTVSTITSIGTQSSRAGASAQGAACGVASLRSTGGSSGLNPEKLTLTQLLAKKKEEAAALKAREALLENETNGNPCAFRFHERWAGAQGA